MRRTRTAMAVFFAVLFSCLLTTRCDNSTDSDNATHNKVNAQGKLIILQAYGNAGNGSPSGVSHSFVELYNISNEVINLRGIFLYYANGTTVAEGPNTAAEDEPWKSITLTGTIPAKSSYLILGAKHDDLSSTRHKITAGYGDINDDNLSLSRRCFKAALIQDKGPLTAKNPFKDGSSGKPVPGYIDMVGAANEYQTRDLIFGFETAPARNSASASVRRVDDWDSNDNSTDFESLDYRLVNGMTDELLESRKPRNSSEGSWDPFADPIPPDPTEAGEPDTLAGKLLILQAYGTGETTDGSISHSFVELYNNTASPVNLSGYSLQYAAGTKVSANAPTDGGWTVIQLDGSIPAKSSFLILGQKNNRDGRHQIADNYGDINVPNMELSNRAFKAALIKGTGKLTVQNPFNMGGGKNAAGYVDMVGTENDNTDRILGFEGTHDPVNQRGEVARISKQAAVRRTNLNDTDNNKADFESLDYRISGISDELLEVRKPRNAKNDGAWDPFEAPKEPDTTGVDYSKLKLNEVSGVGDDPEKFYELFNTGTETISLFGCKIYYNANGTNGGTLPTGKGSLTWTGSSTQEIEAGELFSLIGRNNPPGTKPGSFTTGLTAARILIITLEDPDGNEIDRCVRAADTANYAFDDMSFSRIPDGTGDFYFTVPTPDATNGSTTAGLTKLPEAPLAITDFDRDLVSVTSVDAVNVTATVTATTSAIATVDLKWTLDGTAQTDITMTPAGDVYTAEILAQTDGSEVIYTVYAVNALGEVTYVTADYTVRDAALDYSQLVLNEVSGNNKYVEIYNSGAAPIPLKGVRLQRNDGPTGGGSEWVGGSADEIPAGAYRLFLFNNYTPASLDTNPAYAGWTLSSGISSGQVLKVALIDPEDNPIDVFIRGDVPLPAWQSTSGVTQDSTNSYSRMDASTWAYAAPTPGAVNGTKAGEIVNPGYLTAQP